MTKHLTAQQRYEISFRLQKKERSTDIAKALGVHRSTISREIRRNKAPHGRYNAEKAQWLSDRRMSARKHYTVTAHLTRNHLQICVGGEAQMGEASL